MISLKMEVYKLYIFSIMLIGSEYYNIYFILAVGYTQWLFSIFEKNTHETFFVENYILYKKVFVVFVSIKYIGLQ